MQPAGRSTSVLTLLQKGLEVCAPPDNHPSVELAKEIATWFVDNYYTSDGFYVWPLDKHSGGPKVPCPKHNPLSTPIESSLETLVYRYFTNNFPDPIEQMSFNFWPTLEALPGALVQVGRSLKRQNSMLFKFRNGFVHFNTRTLRFQIISKESNFWKSLNKTPHFCREFENIPWTPQPLSNSEQLIANIAYSKLSMYLVYCQNTPRTIIFFYALIGRMLHQSKKFDNWTEILAIHSEQGQESTLVYLIRHLFNPYDVAHFTINQPAPSPDERPPQLALLHIPRRPTQRQRKRRVHLTRLAWPKAHHLVYGDIYSLDSAMNLLMIRDQCSTDANACYLELRANLAETIQLANHLYFFAVKTAGFKDSLSDWADFWQQPCAECNSLSMCTHLFDNL